jgi:hypothetical protein
MPAAPKVSGRPNTICFDEEEDNAEDDVDAIAESVAFSVGFG